jgi:hypothetical protein
VELHLGKRGSRVKRDRNFRFVVMEQSDHTFSTRASQRMVVEIVRDHLDRQQQAGVDWAGMSGRVATT